MRGCDSLVAVRASLLGFAVACLWAPGVAHSSTAHSAPSPKKPFAYNTSGAVEVEADPGSVTGPAVLQFAGLTGAIFDPKVAQPLNPGQFYAVPASLTTGQPTTFNDTPFEVEIQTPEFNKSTSVPLLDKIFPTLGKDLDLKTQVENSLLLKGHLDGTVSGNGTLNIIATVDSIKLGSMDVQTQDHVTHYAFPIRYSQLQLPTGWTMSNASTTPVSDPTTTTTTGGTMIPATATTPTILAPAPAAEMLITTPTPTPTIVVPSPAAEMLTTTPTPTPEPSTIVIFATALGTLVLGRRFRSTR